nr:DUF4143 domain-containing protein [Halochromatium salexigens]
MDLSVPTLKRYLALLEQTYMIRLLPPFETNLKKRLVRSPKLYLRDTGVLHALLEIEDFDQLLANPQVGESWEAFVIEQVVTALPRWRPSFVRTGNGAEIDLLLERGGQRRVFEIKLSKAPKPSREQTHRDRCHRSGEDHCRLRQGADRTQMGAAIEFAPDHAHQTVGQTHAEPGQAQIEWRQPRSIGERQRQQGQQQGRQMPG